MCTFGGLPVSGILFNFKTSFGPGEQEMRVEKETLTAYIPKIRLPYSLIFFYSILLLELLHKIYPLN